MKVLSYLMVAICGLLVAAMLPARLIVACWQVADEVLEAWLTKVKGNL